MTVEITPQKNLSRFNQSGQTTLSNHLSVTCHFKLMKYFSKDLVFFKYSCVQPLSIYKVEPVLIGHPRPPPSRGVQWTKLEGGVGSPNFMKLLWFSGQLFLPFSVILTSRMFYILDP